MKILFLSSAQTWGGGEKWHLETASALNGRGYKVAVAASAGAELYDRSMRAGLPALPLRLSNLSFISPSALVRLYNLFRRERPDVLILNLSRDLKAAAPVARMAGVPRVIYRRGSALPVRNNLLNRFLYNKLVDSIIANSMETRRVICSGNPPPFAPEKVKVIYNGIDLERFDALPVKQLSARLVDHIYIGTLGRLEAEKNHHILITVAGILKAKGIKCRILIAGSGSLAGRLRKQAHNEGVEDMVEFMGFVGDIRSFLHNLDIFVLPSLYEGFGYVKIEAMACFKPVVAFHTSSNPEVIVDGETGFLVGVNQAGELADRIIRLIADPDLRRNMGIKGRRRVEEMFDGGKSLAALESLINGLFCDRHFPGI